jgi:superfamily II DNA or RNA helicase
MLAELGNIWTTVRDADIAERRWLTDFLTYTDTKANFVAWKFGLGSGKVELFDTALSRFPSGYLSTVAQTAPQAGFRVDVQDKRVRPVDPDPNARVDWLRDYQVEAVEKAVRRTRGILWIPTGGGKTEIAAALTQRVPARWLFLVHRTNLLDNAAERYERRTGAKAGRIGERGWSEGDGGFLVATFQTLWAALKKGDPRAAALLESAEGLIVDEAHTLPAGSFYRVAMKARNAYWRIGLSGTPLARSDRRSMFTIAATGQVIFRLRPETLISRGVLSRPSITMEECVQPPIASQNWAKVYREGVVKSAARNALLASMVQRASKPCLVFVQHLSHGQVLAKLLASQGIRAKFATGAQSVERRMAQVKELTDGRLDALVCTVIFQEGVDIPDLRAVVVGTGGASAIAAIQRMGRGMRVAEGKTSFEVWDVADVGNRWLERHAIARRRAYEAEGHHVTIK